MIKKRLGINVLENSIFDFYFQFKKNSIFSPDQIPNNIESKVRKLHSYLEVDGIKFNSDSLFFDLGCMRTIKFNYKS